MATFIDSYDFPTYGDTFTHNGVDYWLRDRVPAPIRGNLACLDYSVARDGLLTAYRFQGCGPLVASSFVTVPRRSAVPV